MPTVMEWWHSVLNLWKKPQVQPGRYEAVFSNLNYTTFSLWKSSTLNTRSPP